MAKAVFRYPRNTPVMDRPAEGRSEKGLSREGNRVSRGYGSPWPIWKTVSAMRRENIAHSLCRQRDQLLRPLPDWRKGACGSQLVPAAWVGLAADVGRSRGAETALGIA